MYCMPMLINKQLTLMLTAAQVKAVAREAKKLRVTKGEFIRRAINLMLSKPTEQERGV